MDKKLLVDCPTNDFDCPYWSWKHHKCVMMAQGEGDPREECDNYWDDSPEDFGETDEPEGW